MGYNMELQITVDYNVPADEFRDLIKKYPLGQYINTPHDTRVNWFRVEIDGDQGKITLTWFQEWV